MGHFANLTREAAGEIAMEMPERGFVSVFEHIKPAMPESQTVWTLWLNMTTGEEVLTVVDARGNKDAYSLCPVLTDKDISEIVRSSCKVFYDGDFGSGTGGIALPDLLRQLIARVRGNAKPPSD